MTGSDATIEVRLADDATSGFASIVQQFLEQQLAESQSRRRRAARLRGRLGLTATDYHASVTVDFGNEGIVVCDGEAEPLDASIAGPYKSLTELLQGRSNPLVEHLRGRLRVKSHLRNPFLPYRVHRLLKLSPERQG
ncbi:MAG TPA: SCP2 sterol-binding domain-containing protein [Candidatus Binataceae bacterium]|nr:SCP2 sterol-binding domain-containing protein [Candidatus Binataceae bacterium]